MLGGNGSCSAIVHLRGANRDSREGSIRSALPTSTRLILQRATFSSRRHVRQGGDAAAMARFEAGAQVPAVQLTAVHGVRGRGARPVTDAGAHDHLERAVRSGSLLSHSPAGSPTPRARAGHFLRHVGHQSHAVFRRQCSHRRARGAGGRAATASARKG